VLIEPQQLLAALRLPATSALQSEILGERVGSPERIRIEAPGSAPLIVVVRRPADSDAASNQIAVMEALTGAGFAAMPRLLAVTGGATVESWVDGATALAFVPPPGSLDAAVTALAALHALPLREGLRWELNAAETLPAPDVPLYRLGFAASEREPAMAPLAAAHEALLASPFGFVHGDATAARFLLAQGRATLINYARAGFGAQLFDVAAFLLTAGLEPPARRTLALRYAEVRDLPPGETANLVDLAGLVWGFETQLRLARRQVEMLGDDAASAELSTEASRIEQGLRNAAGDHPMAAAIRSALWPS
jgi:hypothetical protein